MTEETLLEFVAVWERQDLDALMAFFTEDAVYEGVKAGVVYRGQTAIREYFARAFANYDGGKLQQKSLFLSGDYGLMEWTYHWFEDGQEQIQHGNDLYEFSGDKIRRKSVFQKIA